MTNGFIPRATVHAWSEAIGEDPAAHQAALSRLLREQRRLTRWLEQNRKHMVGSTVGVSLYLTGVIIRMFDLGGGRLKSGTWAHVREAEARVGKTLGSLLPLDDGFAERFRSTPRAQPHILDEAYMALFERQREEEEEDLAEDESLKVLMMMWVVTEVLDANWRPPKATELDESYTYVHIEPSDEA